MGIIDKMLKIAGRDSNGFARPIKTNEDGNLEVILKGSDGGTSTSAALTSCTSQGTIPTGINAGTYTVVATADGLVPTVCKVVVE